MGADLGSRAAALVRGPGTIRPRRRETAISTAATISHAPAITATIHAVPSLSMPATTATAMMNPASIRNRDRKSTRLNSSHVAISYAVFCLKKKKNMEEGPELKKKKKKKEPDAKTKNKT